jgi:FKBP-type peptidyl-prolyl cis-trans isomerase SlyD
MEITQHKFVTLEYRLTNDQGTVLDHAESKRPFTYIHGTRAILPNVEQALEGKSPGDEVTIRIPCENAYGERDESLVFTTSMASFDQSDNLRRGTKVRVRTSKGERILTITEIEGDRVTMDGNHPLAGIDLNFEISVVEVRDCTQEELDKNRTSPGEDS